MQIPLVSILTPFKNTKAFLTDCIDSVLNQTFTNWEMILVDDFSTDESYKLVKEFSKKDLRIKLFKNTNKGIIGALQLAFEHSQGSFITRMDSDDIMDVQKLEILAHNLKEHGNNHVAVGLVKYFSEDDIGDGYSKYENWLNELTKTGSNFFEIYKECVIPSPCWMIHKEDLMTSDAFNPYRYPEDYDLTFRFYEQGFSCIPCQEILHYWRDYPTRSSRTHEHYALNYFLDLKMHYFLKLDYDTSRPLVVWGAGFKGKMVAKTLVEKQIPFYWICNNPKKIGKKIYKQKMLDFTYIEQLENSQSIITVANEDAQAYIKTYMQKLNKRHMKDYFFFC
ncbi:glycosyltransferase family 2 protein [Yeosuana sp. MJ-SS3]|uniref:Glycosyltransferase family 2 protein n=1 Tax=Gilvirhabdus luticola TaxID=3079858 RepID=A0ABU3UA74_9FLAO|nr:glycosyltransferase family 2 protein [Yeosuana sp. MJ-SS3]MDU8887293.1 glycosyltransferase family 2 protein [Yeosuana sp. MJ-SS3]